MRFVVSKNLLHTKCKLVSFFFIIYLFFSECHEKFGPELGEEVWEATNTVFDAMPIAAVIDEKVCIHCSYYVSILLVFIHLCVIVNVCIYFCYYFKFTL